MWKKGEEVKRGMEEGSGKWKDRGRKISRQGNMKGCRERERERYVMKVMLRKAGVCAGWEKEKY